jgi:hypothetical protein
MSGVATDPETIAIIRRIATAMQANYAELVTDMTEYVGERLPNIVDGDAGDLVTKLCLANNSVITDGLIRNMPLHAVAPTVEVRQLTRALARLGIEISTITRGYRIGMQRWIELWTAAVLRYAGSNADAVSLVQAGSRYGFTWLDQLTECVTEEFRDEAARLAHERSLAQVELVQRTLDDAELDRTEAGARLRYNLNARHIALVLCHPSGVANESATRQFLGSIGTAPALIVRVDTRTSWCWVPYNSTGPVPVPVVNPPLIAACGRPHWGLPGFRTSHREAVAAMRVAELAGRGPGTITQYDDVAIAAVCSADPNWCRSFIRDELGRLGADDEAARRARETVEEFFAANSNFRIAAARLGIHHNTVRYRLDRAEQLLGRPVAERRLTLELALNLASQLQPWSLHDTGD